jgi:hypothetical protein
MLLSTLRNYPLARVRTQRDAYGVWLDAETYLRVSYSAGLTVSQQRDLLVLLSVWLVAKPNELLKQNTPRGG